VKKCTGLEKLCNLPKHKIIATLPIQYVFEIAKIKRSMDDELQHLSLDMICRVAAAHQMIIGQCDNMGVVVVPGDPATDKAVPIKITLK